MTYLTAKDAAAYLQFPSVKAFDHWVTRRGVPSLRRGRIRLFAQDVLDRVLRMDAQKLARPA